tara:strand:- start:2658 stop:3110 length:453 start_codon:yes stop_codon:yes gene_type:complete
MAMSNRWSWQAIWALLRGCKGSQILATSSTAVKGALGEKEAKRHLQGKGFKIVKRNWRKGRDEIDLICLDGETLVFVEVRTRKDGALISGYHSIGPKKKRALLRVCKAYLRQARDICHYRFDVVEARWLPNENLTCLHYENVALFPNRSH